MDKKRLSVGNADSVILTQYIGRPFDCSRSEIDYKSSANFKAQPARELWALSGSKLAGRQTK